MTLQLVSDLLPYVDAWLARDLMIHYSCQETIRGNDDTIFPGLRSYPETNGWHQ
jgi:hypothetical protein